MHLSPNSKDEVFQNTEKIFWRLRLEILSPNCLSISSNHPRVQLVTFGKAILAPSKTHLLVILLFIYSSIFQVLAITWMSSGNNKWHQYPNGHTFVEPPSIWHQNSTSKACKYFKDCEKLIQVELMVLIRRGQLDIHLTFKVNEIFVSPPGGLFDFVSMSNRHNF